MPWLIKVLEESLRQRIFGHNKSIGKYEIWVSVHLFMQLHCCMTSHLLFPCQELFADGYIRLCVCEERNQRLCIQTFSSYDFKVSSISIRFLCKYSQKDWFYIWREEYRGVLKYYVPTSDTTDWSKIFDLMEIAKRTLRIEAYSVSQTSLESVFLSVTRHQRQENVIDTPLQHE